MDDEQSVRDFAARALVGGGYEVALAANGFEALEIAERQGPFDLCLIDLRMPFMNGDESWELPVPATYVIARDQHVALAYIEVDYRKRLEPEALLRCLKWLS